MKVRSFNGRIFKGLSEAGTLIAKRAVNNKIMRNISNSYDTTIYSGEGAEIQKSKLTLQTDKATTFGVAHSIAARLAHSIALPLARQSRYRQFIIPL